ITPLEIKHVVNTGLKLDINNPLDCGADLVANTNAAISLFQSRIIILVAFVTATII
ncbi:type III pantothenate kinase, partial [Francisella tularensis subsp. holarctica]|nr:type III pantothenate kinase [Francisella tularensis subsp. holarctica]